jgi:hypothetical protein
MKYIPLSIVLFTVFFAAIMGGKPRPAKTARTLVIVMAIFLTVWAWLCVNIYPQHVFIE